MTQMMGDFNTSQWLSALSDLKDALHDEHGFTPEQTDGLTLVECPDEGCRAVLLEHLGDDGECTQLTVVYSPGALRKTRPHSGGWRLPGRRSLVEKIEKAIIEEWYRHEEVAGDTDGCSCGGYRNDDHMARIAAEAAVKVMEQG